MRFAVLGSGSSGNAAVLECGDTRLLIDAGLSAKQLTLRLHALGITPETLTGVLLTHEHGDHIRGLKTLSSKTPVRVFATRETAQVVRESGITAASWSLFESGQSFAIESLHISAFQVQHDAVDPVGFVLRANSRSIGIVSDAGHVTRSMTHALAGVHTLFIEANYDESLLEADLKRPWATKQRIRSRHGHLSNHQVADLLHDLAHPGMHQVLLGHLSSDCNHPETALQVLCERLASSGHRHIQVSCAPRDHSSGWFEV
jgi:phosphoribosyl 1,2-cyclic phosphodiesterase